MRFWSGSLLLGLLVVLYLQSCVEGENAKGMNVCCTSFYQRQIPAGRIVSYEETSLGCTRPGLIFVVRNGKRVCVNPNLGWVQRVRGEIDWKSVDNSTDPTE
ncbi:C-C motif chemokine 3-like [Astyanax mexicanus]|uniref:C-C motif chemokine n=1 Tax=Astyanax mexicanus TaxID=7994 RepID=A0A8T2LR87_ASTMX|nr:C-C motif chemokine 3-like [Astyanax mexicanus]